MKIRRFFCALLAALMLLSTAGVPAHAASGPELPDLSSFLGSKYTQNVKGDYTYYVTCIYSEDLGTGPLDEFLNLLQEDRYQLKLTGTSKEYPDSWDKAGTCKDWFFQYTGSDSSIQLITTSSGDSYHVRVTLYTYTDKDYNAIVFYREPDFVLKDSGVHLGDKAGKTIPALNDYFETAERKEARSGETAYFFDFTTLPSTRMSNFSKAMQELELKATDRLEVGSSRLQLFHVEEAVVVTVWWHNGDKELEVIVHDDALKAAGYGQKTTKVKKPVVEISDNDNGGGSSGGGGGSSIFDNDDDNKTKWRPCTNCSNGKEDCSKCGGVGYKIKRESVPNYSGKGSKWTETKEYCSCSFGKVTCSDCDGSGKIYY